MHGGEFPSGEDTKFRHYVEGKLQYATLESQQALEAKVDKILRVLVGDDTMNSTDTGLQGKVIRMEKWLQGDTSDTGTPSDGVLRLVAVLWHDRKVVLGLLGAGVTALVIQTIVAVFSTWLHFTEHVGFN